MATLMDGGIIALFVLSTLVGGIVTGLAGFAFGLVVSGLWLHLITPLETATLIMIFSLPVQIYGNWRLRRVSSWRHVVPIMIGSIFGIPLGAWLLHFVYPPYMRLGVGVLLVAYSFYGLFRPKLTPLPSNRPAEVVLGFVNGIVAGLSGLGGILVTIWSDMRGWAKDQQRAMYQPILLMTVTLSLISYVGTGAVTMKVTQLFLYGLPALALGVWIGFALYDRINDTTFRKVVLILLLVSGLALAVPELF